MNKIPIFNILNGKYFFSNVSMELSAFLCIHTSICSTERIRVSFKFIQPSISTSFFPPMKRLLAEPIISREKNEILSKSDEVQVGGLSRKDGGKSRGNKRCLKKKSFTTLKAYISLSRGHVQCFDCHNVTKYIEFYQR
jgi:hypothetical protein